MILRNQATLLTIVVSWIFLPIVKLEDAGPIYDTGDWIPITPDNNLKSVNREPKSSDRILNIEGINGGKFMSDGKFPYRKSAFVENHPRKTIHIKRSPNQRPRPKVEQPYRFESLLVPPPKHHQIKTFPQKTSYQQGFNIQPQYRFSLRNPLQNSGQQIYQPLPIPQNHQPFYNLNTPQIGSTIPKYSTIPLDVQYQQPNLVPQIPSSNVSFTHNTESDILNHAIVDSNQKPKFTQNAPIPTEERDSVQLLYVPLEQLQKQQHFDGDILDDAFKSLQKQKLVSQPPETTIEQQKPEALPLVSQQSFIGDQKYLVGQEIPSQIQNQEEAQYYELISKNQGELFIQNNQQPIRIPVRQQSNIQAERQKIVEITSPKPQRQNVNSAQSVQQIPQKFEKNVQLPPIQQTRNQFAQRGHQGTQTYSIQQQPHSSVRIKSPQLQQPYLLQNQPQIQNYFSQDSSDSSQRSRLQSIQRDILQQTLEVEKLQKQIQQGKASEVQGKNNPQTPKKRKPHQPPLAVYMEGNNQGDIEAVLQLLKNAKSIAVQDQIGPNTPQVFVGPSNLKTPDGFAKFPLPYLSNLDNNRIQRKAQQLPFFVAPLNYREPEGYSKIPLPSPHVGSVVISMLKLRDNLNEYDAYPETNRPITNYQFVNPEYEPVLENHSNFENNLNAYSLDSSAPRESPNRQLKEQTLFQQITGFSGLGFPQNPYFGQFQPEPQQVTSDKAVDNEQPEQASRTTGTQRDRIKDESSKGRKKPDSSVEEPRQPQSKRIRTQTRFQETSTPQTEEVEVSSRNPLTQNYFNRFAPNNNYNYNFISSTPNYAIPSQSSIEEIPANIRKLNVQSTFHAPEERKPQSQNDVRPNNVAQTIPTSQFQSMSYVNNRTTLEPTGNDFELPEQFTNINPNLPGLVNDLQDQVYHTKATTKIQTSSVISTRPPITTTEYIVQSTEPSTTTTRKPRGRGRSRFNMKTTTSPPQRRTLAERRRPVKTTTETYSTDFPRRNNYESTEIEKERPRQRLQTALTERVMEASAESTQPPQQYYQNNNRPEISQNQLNYFTNYQDPVHNENLRVNQYEIEPQTEKAPRVVEQYLSQKVTPAEELPQQHEEQVPARQIPEIKSDRSELPRTDVTQKSIDSDKPTRRRVRVRGRPRNKYSSSTSAPRSTTSAEVNDQTEFYGFIRQPNYSQSSQVNYQQDQQENIHIYAPTQQKTPSGYVHRNYESVATSSPRVDTETTIRFLGELRPKYSSPSRSTTTQLPESSATTQRGRVRGRVRVPGRSYETRVSQREHQTTERPTRVRTRGRAHFTPPRNAILEDSNETENYPVSYLKNRESSSTPSSSEFKITVDPDDMVSDQVPYSTINHAKEFQETITKSEITLNTAPYSEEYKNDINKDEKSLPIKDSDIPDERMKQDGFKVVDIDNFDTAESQSYNNHFNSLGGIAKVNDLKSKEIEDNESPSSSFERNYFGTNDSFESLKNFNETVPLKYLLQHSEETNDSLEKTNQSEETKINLETTTTFTSTPSGEDINTETTSTIASKPEEVNETTTTLSPEENLRIGTSTEAVKETVVDLFSLQTSTSTEISQETEICYKGKCVKSRNKKLRRPLS